MSLKTFVIVIGALVALFVFGLAGSACGGLSSGTGLVDAASGLLGAPHLEAKDLKAANPACLDVTGNALVFPANVTLCTYDLDDSVSVDRRLVLRDGFSPAAVQVEVKQQGLPTFKKAFPLKPDEEEFRAFIERKRSKIVNKEPSTFTVKCTRVPLTQPCRLPLR